MKAKVLKPDQAATLIGDVGFVNALLERDPSVLIQVRQHFGRPSELDGALRELRSRREHDSKAAGQRERARYEIEDGGFAFIAGEQHQRLTNFTLQIQVDTRLDDGVEQKHVFVLEGRGADGTKWADLQLEPAELNRHGWHVERLGASAVLEPVPRANDHLLAAIQTLSSPEKQTAYTHTGFRLVNDHPVFLHAAGAIGGEAVQTRLEGQLGGYRLPDVVEDAAGALRLSMAALNVGPSTLTVPLLLAAYRAPLNELLPVDVAVHVYGRSGAQKSTIVALILSHFGDFTFSHLPACWNDTEAALEYYLSCAKDVLAVVDDWSPKTSDVQDEMRRKAAKVFRAIGNRSPRRRMRADLTARPARPPRGLVISTGEDVPTEESIVARLLLVPVRKGDIDKPRLTELQHNQHRLGHAMRAFIEWLIPRFDALKVWLPARFRARRSEFQHAGDHLRAGAAAAHLAVAGDVLARFAFDLGVLDAEGVQDFMARAGESLASLIDDQGSRQEESDPVRRFLSWLMDLEAQRSIRIESTTGCSSGSGLDTIVGWQDATHLFLLQSPSLAAVNAAMKQAGEAMTVSSRSLWQRMHEAGVLVKEEKGGYTTKRTFGGRTVRVVRLRKDKVAEMLGTASTSAGVVVSIPKASHVAAP